MNYNKYEQSLLEAASSLDVLIQSDICFKQNVLDIFSNGDDTCNYSAPYRKLLVNKA